MKPSSLHASLLCLTVLTLAACGKGKPQTPPAMPPPEVGVIKVTPQNVPLTKDLVGRLTAYRSADVRARVPGVLLKRTYEEGTDVKQGQLLFQIDPAPLKSALGASSGALAQAQAAYTNAKTFARRARELAPKGFISRVDLDNALAAERSAAAAVQAASANAQSARINLGYASVTAPIAGRAGKQQVTEGALVGNGEATLLTTVEQIDPLYVNFTMSVAAMQQMRSAQRQGNLTLAKPDQATVRIILPDGSTYAEPGVLNFSDTSVNPATGAVDLRATIPNPEHRLLPGMYVTLTATLGEQNKVFVVPQQAVLRDTVGAYVMAIGADGKVERKDVTTADTQGGNWIITSGLKPGDTLVVSGIQNVKAGAPAKASPWHAPAPAGSKPAAAGTAHSGN
jgi:membrane fusion protein (multidrug efflux system)